LYPNHLNPTVDNKYLYEVYPVLTTLSSSNPYHNIQTATHQLTQDLSTMDEAIYLAACAFIMLFVARLVVMPAADARVQA
jgi:hypothetical protein